LPVLSSGLFSKDTQGNNDSTEISITFIAEDLLPPEFTSDIFNYYLPNPKYSGNQQLFTITAKDGDTDIDEVIEFKIEKPILNCQVRVKNV
jgi:hypothetical protein